jgi:hypothetical protein
MLTKMSRLYARTVNTSFHSIDTVLPGCVLSDEITANPLSLHIYGHFGTLCDQDG